METAAFLFPGFVTIQERTIVIFMNHASIETHGGGRTGPLRGRSSFHHRFGGASGVIR
jgi:hypothetical protein